jgi:hypothetical protein
MTAAGSDVSDSFLKLVLPKTGSISEAVEVDLS